MSNSLTAKKSSPRLVTIERIIGCTNENADLSTFTVSPDVRRVAYGAKRGEKWFAVVDSVEGKEYDAFLKGSQLVFDSPNFLHSLAVKNKEILSVDFQMSVE